MASDDTNTTPPPPPPPPPGGGATPPTTDGGQDPARRWKTWQLAATAFVALLLGVAAGGGAGDPEPAASGGSAPQPTVTVTVKETQTETKRVPGPTETVTAAPTAPEPSGTGTAGEAGPQDGTYTAGAFELRDVQVSEDFAGDFAVRARVTNNGPEVDSLGISVTIFSGGSVVGTADGLVGDTFGTGETRTVEFVSSDPFTSWDEVEFQVEFSF
jgi:hypothetical protein